MAPPIIWDLAPIQYLLNSKIPIYCRPLQCQFSDYLPVHCAMASVLKIEKLNCYFLKYFRIPMGNDLEQFISPDCVVPRAFIVTRRIVFFVLHTIVNQESETITSSHFVLFDGVQPQLCVVRFI